MTSPDALPGPAPSDRDLRMLSVPAPVGTASSQWAIQNLIAAYAELLDAGDFAGVGALLADATFTGSGPPVSGSDAIKRARLSPGRTSPSCRRCPTYPCNPSPAAGTMTVSSVAADSGVSRRGAPRWCWSRT
jgi:hypothetical protein